MKYQIKNISIGEALKAIENHEYSLPSIQRPYQWGRRQIEGLIASLIEGYPLNLMTFMKVDRNEMEQAQLAQSYSFITRFVQYDFDPKSNNASDWLKLGQYRSSPEDLRDNVKYLVFDGQQRLTSLNIAFRGSFASFRGGQGFRRDHSENYKPKCLFVRKDASTEQDRKGKELPDFEFDWLPESEATDNGGYSRLVVELPQGRFLNLRKAFALIEAEESNALIEAEKKPVFEPEDNSLEEIFNKLKKALSITESDIPTDGEEGSHLMVLEMFEGTIQQGFQTFMRINNSGTPVSKGDLCLASISCTWLNARQAFEKLESELKPSDDNRYYNEGAEAEPYRQIALQASLIVATSLGGKPPKVEVEISSFTPEVSLEIEKNWSKIESALLKAREVIGELKLAATNRGLRQTLFYLCFHFTELKSSEVAKKLRTIHVCWFNNQSTENAKLAVCTGDIQKIASSKGSIQDALDSVLKKIGCKTIDEMLSLSFGDRATRKVLQIIDASPTPFNPDHRYDVDHLHPSTKTDEILKSIEDKEEQDRFNVMRNSIANLQLLGYDENRGAKKGKNLKDWINDLDQDQRNRLLLFPPTLDVLELEKCRDFWSERKGKLKEKIEDLFYLP